MYTRQPRFTWADVSQKKCYHARMDTTYELILDVFQAIPDPRVERTKVHSLEIIMFIALCTYITGGQSFHAMQLFAQTREDWLKEKIGMVSIPSHDTFNRVFQAISPEHFGECLINLTNRLREKISGDIVAFDGKTHRGVSKSKDTVLHMLNAWSVENRLVLGQLAVEEKSNEITAIPKLMDILDLKGCVVTADAMNCQKKIASKAVEKKADYVLALKDNHPVAHKEIRIFMDNFHEKNPSGFETIDKGHGRIEIRKYWQTTDIDWFHDKMEWKGLKSFCMVEATREIQGQVQKSSRYFISSLGKDQEEKAAHAIRAHWQIENALHWRLDVVFNEDQSRARTRNAAKNLGTLRAITMNLIKKIPGKGSLKGKRYQASLSDKYLLMALQI